MTIERAKSLRRRFDRDNREISRLKVMIKILRDELMECKEQLRLSKEQRVSGEAQNNTINMNSNKVSQEIITNAQSIDMYNSDPRRRKCPECGIQMVMKENDEGGLIVYLPHLSDCKLWPTPATET